MIFWKKGKKSVLSLAEQIYCVNNTLNVMIRFLKIVNISRHHVKFV